MHAVTKKKVVQRHHCRGIPTNESLTIEQQPAEGICQRPDWDAHEVGPGFRRALPGGGRLPGPLPRRRCRPGTPGLQSPLCDYVHMRSIFFAMPQCAQWYVEGPTPAFNLMWMNTRVWVVPYDAWTHELRRCICFVRNRPRSGPPRHSRGSLTPDLASIPSPLLHAMVTCHTVTCWDGRLVGNEVEVCPLGRQRASALLPPLPNAPHPFVLGHDHGWHVLCVNDRSWNTAVPWAREGAGM